MDHRGARSADADGGAADGDAVPPLNRVGSDLVLARKWTTRSLQQQLAQRKYARYQEDKAEPEDDLRSAGEGPHAEQGRIQRGKKKVKALINVHLISLGINPKVPPVELLADDFLEKLCTSTNKTTKGKELVLKSPRLKIDEGSYDTKNWLRDAKTSMCGFELFRK